MKKRSNILSFFQISILVIINVFAYFFGNKLEWFNILQIIDNEYSVNYSGFANFLFLVGFNILTVYNLIMKIDVEAIVKHFDQNGDVRKAIKGVNEGIQKVEAHLINYDSNSIEFNYLSAIEAEVGVSKQTIHNEIWILTNNFEESNDSDEAIQLRLAIKNNLRSNVDYYYIIPKLKECDMLELIRKVKDELKGKKINGSLRYITDDALDFIPTSYFDIVMYFKISLETGRIDDSSEVYYCFSRMSTIPNEEEKFFYQKVTEKEIMLKLKERTREYKKEKGTYFINALH